MSIQYQNPGTVNAVLDSETIGTDQTTLQPVVREFIIPVESVSGYSPYTQLVELMGQMLIEVRRMRFLMEAEATPGVADEIDEASPASDESDSDESQGS